MGSPTEEDYRKLSSLVEERVLLILKKSIVLPKMDLRILFSKKEYGEEQVELAADLVHKMLKWVPSDRISARDAMEHPFLADVQIRT